MTNEESLIDPIPLTSDHYHHEKDIQTDMESFCGQTKHSPLLNLTTNQFDDVCQLLQQTFEVKISAKIY
ncbi:hypothetical protein QR98_0097610 [Sarcoptes scabiei]|uniref:Uncharacterized protein n=1 Tax=Sarcoptes scabiei TaxID=52283 RepID=A0A132AJP1_SARSC|nr:hypothetical protein QR98_0097610 [Sarcoptes scabiei]